MCSLLRELARRATKVERKAARTRGTNMAEQTQEQSKETKDIKGLPESVKAKKAAYARMRRTGGGESP